MMLANVQGNPLSNNSGLPNPAPGQLYDHTSKKVLYFSCHLQGMKAHFRAFKNKIAPEKLLKIEKELFAFFPILRDKEKIAQAKEAKTRGLKSPNFPVGRILRAKIFRTKCVNFFADICAKSA